jgi:hypothetical protein
VANRLLRRVRDYAQVRANGIITAQVARDALSRLNVDEFGLDDMDARILKTIIEKFSGGPGRTQHGCRGGGRRQRDPGGSVRAVPDPTGFPRAHREGPGRDGACLSAVWNEDASFPAIDV